MDCISNLDKDATWPPMAPSSLPYPLTSIEYQRYGRQLVLPAFGGVQSQLRLRNAKALVVGAGGLGCPAVQYLASAGVGAITVVDHDNVERSNLARQVLHTEDRIGMAKVQSIREAVKSLNPHVRVIPVHEPFTSLNATDLVAQHDLVLDCTDNPLTRYLINDAAVLADKMVVSGAAQGTEGQLMVLHKHLPTLDPSDSPQRGPCYRCLFPIAPNPQDVTACEDGGVLGTITGILGTMQANEAIKLLTGMIAEEELSEVEAISASRNRTAPEITDPKDTTTTTTTSSSPPCQSTLAVPVRMLLASPMSLIPFRSIKLRPRAPNCRACGDESVLAEQNLRRISDLGQEDYHTFCGLPPTEEAQEEGEDITLHMTVKDLASMTQSGGPWLILDVRTSEEYHIVKLPRTLHVPWTQIRQDPQATAERILELTRQPCGHVPPSEGTGIAADTTAADTAGRDCIVVPVLCKQGNDSLLASRALNQAATDGSVRFVSVKGGMREWSRSVDPSLPTY